MLICDRTNCENRADWAIWTRFSVVLECQGHGMDTIRHNPKIRRERITKAAHEQAARELKGETP